MHSSYWWQIRVLLILNQYLWDIYFLGDFYPIFCKSPCTWKKCVFLLLLGIELVSISHIFLWRFVNWKIIYSHGSCKPIVLNEVTLKSISMSNILLHSAITRTQINNRQTKMPAIITEIFSKSILPFSFLRLKCLEFGLMFYRFKFIGLILFRILYKTSTIKDAVCVFHYHYSILEVTNY